MLAKAMAKGHLPSWKTLDFRSDGGASDLVKDVEAGHLNRVKELGFFLSDVRDPGDVYSLLRAFQGREEKLEVLHVTLQYQDDHDFQHSYHELLSSPACSDLRKLVVHPRIDESSMQFVSDYLDIYDIVMLGFCKKYIFFQFWRVFDGGAKKIILHKRARASEGGLP